MPVVRDVPLNLDMEEVLRRQGIGKKGAVRPRIWDLLEELLDLVESRRFLEAACAWEIFPIIGMDGSRLSLAGGKDLYGPALPVLLGEAKELAAVVCTIGRGLEEQIKACMKDGQPLRGLLLDGIGSSAVDGLVREALKFVAVTATARGLKVSSPVNPGMPGFPMTGQPDLLELVGADKIGVCLSASGMLQPRKSVTMVTGIGLKMPELTQAEVCSRCSIRKTCSYRKYD